MVSNRLDTDLKTEGDGAQGRRAVGYEATLLGVDDEHLILPGEEVVTSSVEAQGIDTDLLSPALRSSEADGEVLQTQVSVGRRKRVEYVYVFVGSRREAPSCHRPASRSY